MPKIHTCRDVPDELVKSLKKALEKYHFNYAKIDVPN